MTFEEKMKKMLEQHPRFHRRLRGDDIILMQGDSSPGKSFNVIPRQVIDFVFEREVDKRDKNDNF